jgi:hypothetical protein
MKKLLLAIIIWFLPYTAYAGMGACHDGNGNITQLEIDANKSSFEQANCVYYEVWKDGITQTDFDRIYDVIKNNQKKYIKWVNEPIVKTQTEKDAADALEQLFIRNETRVSQKLQYDVVYLRALVEITMSEINDLRKWTRDFKTATAGASTLAQFKTAVAALPTLNDRTLLQLRNSLEAKVDELTQ